MIASGIVRVASFDGTKEHTFGFGLSGTFLISPLGFFSGNPAFYYFEACEDCVLLRFSKQKFIDLTKQSHDFACWMLQISIGQFHSAENKASIMHGSAKEKNNLISEQLWKTRTHQKESPIHKASPPPSRQTTRLLSRHHPRILFQTSANKSKNPNNTPSPFP